MNKLKRFLFLKTKVLATQPRLGDTADLPNTQNQRGSQNQETKKCIPNDRTRENSRKRTKWRQATYQIQSSKQWLLSENFNKEIARIKKDTETIKKNWSEVRN